MGNKKSDNSRGKGIIDVENSPSLKSWGRPIDLPKNDVVIECGWGRLIFAHTFKYSRKAVELLKKENPNKRDIAFYVRDPHVVIAYDPQELFINPSYTYRLALKDYKPPRKKKGPFTIRPLDTKSKEEVEGMNSVYKTRDMLEIETDFLNKSYNKRKYLKYWVAIDNETEEVIGACLSIDHKKAFDDPENGISLWSVAVNPQAAHPGIGIGMVHHVARHFKKEKRSILDLSVLHSNKEAISLYRKIGFVQIPVFSIKNKNSINQSLYTGPKNPQETLNPYSMIIINEARKRGIKVDILDPVDNFYGLSSGGTSIVCRESLTDMTSSIAMSRCLDRRITTRLLDNVGLFVPHQMLSSTPTRNMEFMEECGSLVVKPCIGIESAGTTVDVSTKEELQRAIIHAKKVNHDVLLEKMVHGKTMRVVIIDFKVVAAAIVYPPKIIGNGEHTILELIEKQSRRRENATQGENKIPVDKELSNTIQDAGYCLEDILPKGRELQVRKNANLQFGGTSQDVTQELHPTLIEAARQAAYALDTPVVGLDFVISDPSQDEYVIVEASVRPKLIGHEPQPVAERFIDFLFPQSSVKENSE